MMTHRRLWIIKEQAVAAGNEAERMLAGNQDHYSGNDGTMRVAELSDYILELLKALDRGELPPMT